MDHQNEIARKFISDYKLQFKALQNSPRNLASVNIPTYISHCDNQMLIKIPKLLKLKKPFSL